MVAAGADLEQARSGGEASWALELADDAGPTWKVEAVNGRIRETVQRLLLIAGEAEARSSCLSKCEAGEVAGGGDGARRLESGEAAWTWRIQVVEVVPGGGLDGSSQEKALGSHSGASAAPAPDERERDRGMREVREGGRDGEYKEAGDAKQR